MTSPNTDTIAISRRKPLSNGRVSVHEVLVSPDSYRALALGCALGTILIGLGAGRWLSHLVPGATLDWMYTSLPVTSAACLVLLGSAMVLVSARRTVAAALLAGIVFLVGDFRLLGTVISPTADLDAWVALRLGLDSGHPGRMSAQMALCLIGGCVAVLGMLRQARVALSAAAASLTVATGAMSAVGYTVDMQLLYGWSGVGRLALDASLAAVFIGLGLLATLAADSMEEAPGFLPYWLHIPVGVSTAVGGLILWHATTFELVSREVVPLGAGSLATLMVSAVASLLFAAVARLWIVAKRGEMELQSAHRALQRSHDELRSAALEIKTLSGLIPMCAWCKSIRDDEGYWDHLESYLKSHADVLVSHGICPKCLARQEREDVALENCQS